MSKEYRYCMTCNKRKVITAFKIKECGIRSHQCKSCDKKENE